ncbi:unnamed protein product [Orchesella dallaii]|uniref:C3H1-type domain-containing protein n=1 Tax=Orchesella dallaii TaxID=48710 RepID=A0ABP1QLL8_9HEXA
MIRFFLYSLLLHLSDLISQNSESERAPFTLTNQTTLYNKNTIRYPDRSRRTLINRKQLPQYRNPFQYILTDQYVSQTFPNPRLRQAIPSSSPNAGVGMAMHDADTNSRDITLGSSVRNAFNPYVLKRVHPIVPPISSTKFANSSSHGNLNSLLVSNNELSTSSSMMSTIGSSVLSASGIGVRPHINPAHNAFSMLKEASCLAVYGNNSSNSSSIYNQSDTCSNANKLFGVSAPTTSNSSSCPKSASKPCTVRTKFKLDRRLKCTPIVSDGRRAGDIVQKTRLIKRYSMRLVSNYKPKFSKGSYFYRHSLKKSIAHFQKRSRISVGNDTRICRTGQRSVPGTGGKPKLIVSISGNKYISKKGGKSLKRVRSGSLAVVNISGSQFVRKNGGRSLNRLKGSFSLELKSLQPQPLNPGLRLAQRAVVKSKLTLSQRTWQKKRFCVFYSRFGECKTKEGGKCPYLHDRKQLLICPKFIVGKCTSTDCKLSHDLKLGRMPPCQFYNKSECSRQNCPYPHVKVTPVPKKNPSKTGKETEPENQKKNASPRRRKLSLKREKPSPKKLKQKKPKVSNSKEMKARYYEQSPDSQPTVSIIPRRFPKEVSPDSDISLNKKVEISANCLAPSNLSHHQSEGNASGESGRRSRLMSRISRLIEKTKKKESDAPDFLPFN